MQEVIRGNSLKVEVEVKGGDYCDCNSYAEGMSVTACQFFRDNCCALLNEGLPTRDGRGLKHPDCPANHR